MSQGPCVKIWAQSDKNWPSYEFSKFRPRWNNIQHSGFSACHALWAKNEGLLNTVWTQYLLWKCSQLNLWNFGTGTSSIRWKSTKLWFFEHNANKLLSQISTRKYLINPHFWRPSDRNWLPAVRDENVDNVKTEFWPPERVQNESRSSSYEFFSA